MFFSIFISVILIFNFPAETQLEKILQKHYKAINIESLNKIKSLEMKGEVEFYLNEESFEKGKPNLAGTFNEIIKLPKQRYYESNFVEVEGSYRQAYNQGEKWIIDGGGLKTNTLNEKAQLKAELWFDITPNLIDLEKRGFNSTYLGKRKHNDQLYHYIKLTHKHGVHFYYLDLKNYLVRIVSFKDEEKMEGHWIKSFFDDYKLIGNIMFAHTRYQKAQVGNDITTMLLRYTDIKTNTLIDQVIFQTPENP